VPHPQFLENHVLAPGWFLFVVALGPPDLKVFDPWTEKIVSSDIDPSGQCNKYPIALPDHV